MSGAELRGPFFDGTFNTVMSEYCTQAEIDAANEGERIVHDILRDSLKHPTGRYQMHVEAQGNRVDDDRMIYGPWLEGTSERNRTTRFKGYASFRRASQELQRRASLIGYRTLSSFIGRMR